MSAPRIQSLFAMLVLSAILSCSLSLFAATRSLSTKSTTISADYLHALAAADRFLQAWQGGDIETGLVMLTAQAKKTTSHDEIEKAFSTSTPSAYEIDRGKLLRGGRYEFPIVLMGASTKRPRRRFTCIVVLNTGHNDWAVDKLP
jgi:hypothetical protein